MTIVPVSSNSNTPVNKTVSINVELEKSTAWALAQFVKRVGWVEFTGNAADESEAYKIREGINAVQDALNREGYSPR